MYVYMYRVKHVSVVTEAQTLVLMLLLLCQPLALVCVYKHHITPMCVRAMLDSSASQRPRCALHTLARRQSREVYHHTYPLRWLVPDD
jgi:hypothetical protein